MKKNVISIITIVILAIIITGCGSKEKNQKPVKQEDEKTTIAKSLGYYERSKIKWNCDVNLNKIKDISWDMFITEENELYEFSLTKVYSNEKLCKKISNDKFFKRFINGSIITSDNKILAYIKDNFVERAYGYVGNFDFSIFDKYEDIFLISEDFSGNIVYARVGENNQVIGINKIDLSTFDKIIPPKFNEIILGQIPIEEKFLSSSNSVLKTDKAYYNYGVINQSECDKYVDIECKYGLLRLNDFSKEYNNINFYNKNFLILKNDDYIYTNLLGA